MKTVGAVAIATVAGAAFSIPSALMLAELNANISRLSPYSVCGNGIAQLNTAIANGRVWLQGLQNADGGFAERDLSSGVLGSSNVMATAIAYKTLRSLGSVVPASVLTNAENWLIGQQTADGSWRNDAFVSAQVLAALPVANGTQLTDTDQDGITDVVEAQLGSNATLADATGSIPTAGLGQGGITVSSLLASGTRGEAFSHALGSGIFFQINTGSLPPGLTLNASTGQVTGTPTQVGSYSFDYTLTPASGAQSIVIARIDIAEPAVVVAANDGDVPTLPEWGMLLLATILLGVMAQRNRQNK